MFQSIVRFMGGTAGFLLGQVLCLLLASAGEAGRVEIIAHRGASHDAPENTLTALKLGFEQGCDAGELDVWISRDGVPVVIHDKDTKRVAGDPRQVSEQTLDELRTLDVGAWKDAKFRGTRIPTLAEALAIIPREKRMFVEIKCGVEGVAPILRAIEMAGLPAKQTDIISFHSEVIAEVKRSRPDLVAHWIVAWKKDKQGSAPTIDELITTARRIRADGLDLVDSPLLDATAAAAVRAVPLKLYVWTVDDADAARRLVQLRVDGITTNRPGWLRQRLDD